MPIYPIDFKYNNSIKFITKAQFNAHKKLYDGYVDKVNEITEDLQKDGQRNDANATYSKYRGLKKGETYAIDGVILHELYFNNIGSENNMPEQKAIKLFKDYFGGYEKWAKDFKACATAARGWCVLCYEQRTKTFRNICLDLHDYGAIVSAYPVLILDMYEHAYFIDYGTDKAEYINNFMGNINWKSVEERLDKIIK